MIDDDNASGTGDCSHLYGKIGSDYEYYLRSVAMFYIICGWGKG